MKKMALQDQLEGMALLRPVVVLIIGGVQEDRQDEEKKKRRERVSEEHACPARAKTNQNTGTLLPNNDKKANPKIRDPRSSVPGTSIILSFSILGVPEILKCASTKRHFDCAAYTYPKSAFDTRNALLATP